MAWVSAAVAMLIVTAVVTAVSPAAARARNIGFSYER
jgi:hypothetical protein